MKKRMAILMSMAIAANMIASVPVCAADIFTDSMTTDSAITQEADDDSFSDGSGTPDFADEQENVQAAQDEGTQSAKEPPVVTAEYESVFGTPTYKINGQFGTDYVENIQQISVNGNNLTIARFSSSLKKGDYYKHSTDQYIQFSADSFEVNDQIVITSTGYKDLTLKVTGTGKQRLKIAVFIGELTPKKIQVAKTSGTLISPFSSILLVTSVKIRPTSFRKYS